jgi:hypothetical protein
MRGLQLENTPMPDLIPHDSSWSNRGFDGCFYLFSAEEQEAQELAETGIIFNQGERGGFTRKCLSDSRTRENRVVKQNPKSGTCAPSVSALGAGGTGGDFEQSENYRFFFALLPKFRLCLFSQHGRLQDGSSKRTAC